MHQVATFAGVMLLGLGVAICGSDDASTRDPTGDGDREATWAPTLQSVPVSWYAGMPRGAEPVTGEDGQITPMAVSWAESESKIQVTVWGSGSCPTVAETASVSDSGDRVILVEGSQGDESEGIPCTADVAPATSVVDVPQSVAEATKVHVIFRAANGAEFVLVLP
ncbi:MAG TPA: hypothetical protein VFK41_06935 [Nocardioidaceae bacterium]|nr:hypothetical protein [Nocardioidaceae bacterium]